MEADAEADPALLYGAYGYGLGHYGYAGLGHYGYAGHLGYGYGLHGLGYAHYYGKREAEAKPEAEADPALLYSTYGYGLGHYGYAGLGHLGYSAYYGKRSA